MILSQPGRPPVEGYSNFTWVLTLAPFFRMKVFHPVIIPKLLAVLLFLASLAIIQNTLKKFSGNLYFVTILCLLIALSPPVIIWTGSGLENGLLLFFVLSLWAITLNRPEHWSLWSGVLTALIAMTRPDGILYLLIFPLLLLPEIAGRRMSAGEAARCFATFFGAFSALFVPFIIYRLTVFGLPLPHTYYAKLEYANNLEHVKAIIHDPRIIFDKHQDLYRGIAGSMGPLYLAGALAGLLALSLKRRMPHYLATSLLFLVVSELAYLWLGNDWMGEYRFATVTVIFALMIIAATLSLPGEYFKSIKVKRAAAWLLLVAGLSITWNTWPRLVSFAEAPPTPFAMIEQVNGHRFNAYAKTLGLEHASLLIADIGGALMTSKLTVYDIAGLIEPAVVQKLRKWSPVWYYHHPEFYDWVFDSIKPTFIYSTGFFTNITAFEQDPRFFRDYIPIDIYKDEYIKNVYQRDLHSGTFVRRDAIPGDLSVDDLRRQYIAPPSSKPFIVRLRDKITKGN